MEFISEYIKEQILSGNTILFLGAGASIGTYSECRSYTGLSGNGLRDLLCDRFLHGKSKNKTLSYVSSLALDIAGSAAVYEFIEMHTKDLQPSDGHKLIPEFRWKAIATTNYDTLIEKSYELDKVRQQKLRRIISDSDDIQSNVSDRSLVPLLKLHGCISKLNSPELPLILSSYDYYKYKTNRESLFNTLKEWAYNYTIVFCGYSISDENIRDLIFDVSEVKNQRPRYILVDPALEEQDINYWKSNRFDCVPLTFSDFMLELKKDLPENALTLIQAVIPSDISFSKFIPSHDRPSAELILYIQNELNHVHSGMVISPVTAKSFYQGNNDGFGWVDNGFDFERGILTTLIEDTIFDEENAVINSVIFYLIKGYAGSGKSVILKRFSWEAAINYGCAVFYLQNGGELNQERIIELASLLQQRIYLVIDSALEHGEKLQDLIFELKKQKLSVTIITGGRTNEWNVHGDIFERDITATYDVLDLSNKEVGMLLEKLTENRCLGYLENLPEDKRYEYLKEKLKNQLLVALHEATEGKTFIEIISDEYEGIYSTEAKIVYLDICTLDRFDVGVRAGLLSRVSGVNFNDFFRTLMSPLENVIKVYYDYKIGDNVYRSRHQYIAEIVFDCALRTAELKSQQIIRIIRYLNNSYDSDRIAISQLIKGKALASQFTEKPLAYAIFNAAEEAGIHPSVIFHQRAVFELHHPGGDLRAALNFIIKAEEDPGNISPRTLSHTKSNIFRRLAIVSDIPLEKNKLRQDALNILNRGINNSNDSLSFFTKGQILLEDLKDKTLQFTNNENGNATEIQNEVINEISKQFELNLTKGLQLFPGDEKLLNLESSFSSFLEDSPRALMALEKSYKRNKDSIFTAIRLSRFYFKKDETKEPAIRLIKEILLNHPTNKEAHYEMARMLISINEKDNKSQILQHLKRSFSSGDTHYDARFYYARHEYLYGDSSKASSEFKQLSKINLSPAILHRVRGEVKNNEGNAVVYSGSVVSLHTSFAFVKCNDFSDNIYIHFRSMTNEDEWKLIKKESTVFFNLGFTFKGPVGNKVQIRF